MKNDNDYNKSNVEIKIDEENVNIRKKPKGWGHWNSFLKSDEYAKLLPSNEEITEEELAKHKLPGDLWIGLMYEKRICVFDVSLFAEYHPGGFDIIQSVAGRDATEDFRVAHAYVNPSMISRFKKGYLVRTAFKSPNSLSPGMTMLPPVRKPQPITKPKWDWTESGSIVLKFYLHKVLLQKLDCVSVLCPDKGVFQLQIFFDNEYYFFEIQFHDYLIPILDSLACDHQGKTISINLRSTLGSPISSLGGVMEDSIMSITDSIDKEQFLQCHVVKTRDLNNNCREFLIQWPNYARIGVPLGHHVIVQTTFDGNTIQRPYTPVCLISPDQNSYKSKKQFTLMIKCYPDGVLSSFMHSLNEDALIMVSLPIGTFKCPSCLFADSRITKPSVSSDIKSMVFIAAGSGITPMIRILLASLLQGNMDCNLLFFNRTQFDIIYLNEFVALAQFYPTRFSVSYILSQPDSDWKGLEGKISNLVIQNVLGGNLQNRFYMICGPKGFNELSIQALKDLQVDSNNVFEFKG